MDITSLVVPFIALIAGALLAMFITLKAQVKEEVDKVVPPAWDWILEQAAAIAVRAAEQLFIENAEKLEYALGYVEKYLDGFGIQVDPVLIRGAIEAALIKFKKELESSATALRQFNS
jgi:hypothetical protein